LPFVNGLVGLIGGSVALVERGHDPGAFRRSHTFLLTASVWLSAALAGALSLWLYDLSPVDATFEALSAITTTGYAITDYTAWGPLAVVVFFGLTAVGGCTGSTAGGAKAMRWIIMGRAIHLGLRRVRYPDGCSVSAMRVAVSIRT